MYARDFQCLCFIISFERVSALCVFVYAKLSLCLYVCARVYLYCVTSWLCNCIAAYVITLCSFAFVCECAYIHVVYVCVCVNVRV